jgi:RNA polymerase sigma-70 factor (ECF subfamily)
MPLLDDRDLISRVANGDSNALKPLLYRTYERLLERIRGKIPRDLQAVVSPEDILQQAHIKAFQSIRTLKVQDDGSFDAWLTAIADNALADERKRQYRLRRGGGRRAVMPLQPASGCRVGDLLDLLPGSGHRPSQSAARREALQALHVALADLPDRQRQAVDLVYLQGLSTEETARRMNITPSAVRALVDRGRDRLRDALDTLSKFISRP